MQHTATHYDVCEGEMNRSLKTNRKGKLKMHKKLDFDPIKCVFHSILPTLQFKICEWNNLLRHPAKKLFLFSYEHSSVI